jgi:hypothetical protein
MNYFISVFNIIKTYIVLHTEWIGVVNKHLRINTNKLIIAFGIAFLLSGCVSFMTAEEQSINITKSNNKPAEVVVDYKTVTAPCMVTVLREGKDKTVKTDTAGCDTATRIKKSVTPVFFGTTVIGGVLGFTTDGVTGKIWDYANSVEMSYPV